MKLSRVSAAAEQAAESARNLRADVLVRLQGEDFAEALAVEIDAIFGRLHEIDVDLERLAHAGDPSIGCGDERYRLAHAGKLPPETLARMEGVGAGGPVAA